MKLRPYQVSIHAPAGGATKAFGSFMVQGRFQSTRPRGARHPSLSRFYLRDVSIHAPAGGATDCKEDFLPSPAFQSTRPRGARRHLQAKVRIVLRFNPRARGGRDAIIYRRRYIQAGFNPRARGGRDARFWRSWQKLILFQSTRPRGARRRYRRL